MFKPLAWFEPCGLGIQGIGVWVLLLLVKVFLKVLEPKTVPSSVNFARRSPTEAATKRVWSFRV